MAQVPDPGATPSVSPSGIADTDQRVSTSPEAFGGGLAQGLDQLGQGLGQASDNVQHIVLNSAQLANQTAINDRYDQLQRTATTLSFGDGTPGSQGFYSKQGKDAVTAYPGMVQQLNTLRDSLSNGLSPMAAQQFDEESRRLVGQQLAGWGQHQQQQERVYAQGVANSTVQGDQQNAILYRDDAARFGNALADGRNTIATFSATNGDAPEVTNQKIRDFISSTYAGVVAAKAETDPVAAQQYYLDHQDQISGPDQVATEQRLKPSLYQWNSRLDADNIVSGATGAVAQNVAAEAANQGVDQGLALTTAKIESGMGSRLQSPLSSASGVFAMTNGTWAANGGTSANRGDQGTQIQLGVKNLASSQLAADQAVGGTATPDQVYLVHQQGAAGGAALLKADAGESAVAALAPAYGGNVALATKAITNNGGTASMTAGQFRDMWSANYQRVASTIAIPGPGTPPGAPTSTDPRDHAAGWLAQANGIMSPLGTADPVYSDMVASRIRAKIGEIEFGQQQQDRSTQNTLLSAALGLTPAAPAVQPPSPPVPGQPVTAAVQAPPPNQPAPPPSTGPGISAGVAAAAGTPPTARPTSIDQLLAISPAVKQAWGQASPEVQRGIMGMIERNSTEGPPVTPQAQTRYYGLLSESTNDPTSFLKENLADPDLLSTMPRGMVSQLMNRQASIDKQQASIQDHMATMTHARAVVMPDLLAAGINPRAASSPNATAQQKQAYADFDGRLDEQLQQFQQQNGKRPDDAQIKTIGQTLLTPGFQQGTGRLFGLIGPTQQKLYQAQTAGTVGSFMPQVPDADRTQIVSAYSRLNGGARPTEQQIATYYMAGRSRMPAPMPGRPRMGGGAMPVARTALPSQSASTAPGGVSNPFAQVDNDNGDEDFGG